MAKRRRKSNRKMSIRNLRQSVKKGYKARKKTGLKPEDLIIPAAIYGGIRAKVSNLLQPITKKIPLGSIADEVLLGGLNYLGAKKAKGKMAKDFFRSGLVVEAARLGEATVDGSAFEGFKSLESSSSIAAQAGQGTVIDL